LGTNSPKKGLVECPECKLGQLMVIRSKSTRKRFMGCSNFYGGCKASSPLLQKARLRATKMACEVCKWPMIIFRYSRNQKWTKQCANYYCESRNLNL
jgi:ssDNA-binding Zn-finger/Zn-ribbon topoisomerase 1